MRRFLIILPLAILPPALALAGCGPDSNSSNSSNSNNSGNSGSSAKQAKCDLAPPSLVKQTLGLDVGTPSATDNGSVLVCTYPPVPGATRTVIVRFDTGSSAAQFKTTRDGYATQNMQTTDYPGFGDEAYTSTISAIGIRTNTLDARKGAVELQISSGASFEQEKALEQKLFDALA
jgi:hypothetical protein